LLILSFCVISTESQSHARTLRGTSQTPLSGTHHLKDEYEDEDPEDPED